MSAAASIQSRVPNADYRALESLNITLLKELRRSPLHFRHAREHPKTSPAMTLGTASHCATLEPERFGRDYAVWSLRTASGRMAPRTGKAWEEFCAGQTGKTILTEDECGAALAIAAAVRGDPVAAKYLESGEPELVLTWDLDGRPCKGRIDWLTHQDDEPVIVGLKTTRDCRAFAFGSAAAKLGYAEQWAWYFEGYRRITGHAARMVEIVVESEPPHAVVVYLITEDILAQGADNVADLLRVLERCEREHCWPGPAECEQVLTLPSWFYGDAGEDVADLGLIA